MTMTEFLNKYASEDYTLLTYWFEARDLEGLTDYEILRKCVWLDMRHSNSIVVIFGFDYFERFVDDYQDVAKNLNIDLKQIMAEVMA